MPKTIPCAYCGQPFTPMFDIFAEHVPFCTLTHMYNERRRHRRVNGPSCRNRTFCRHCGHCLACESATPCPTGPERQHEQASLMTEADVRALRKDWDAAKRQGSPMITQFAEPYAQRFFVSNYDIRAILHGDTWTHVPL